MNAAHPAEVLARARVAQPSWATLSVEARTRTLRELRLRIASIREAIVEAVVADTGKVALDALSGDVLVTLEQMLFYERHAKRLLARQAIGKSSFLFSGCRFYQHFEPHGVALIYAPANYPFQLAMVPTITALYAGNTVVLKISERTPAVAKIIRDLCAEVLPQGVLQVVHDGPQTAPLFLEAGPDILFFTGSTATGRSLAERAGALLIPAILELGGKDAAIVFADCHQQRTIDGIVSGAFANAGQVCVGIKRLLIEQTIFDTFLGALRGRVQALCSGPIAARDFGTIQDKVALASLAYQVRDALSRGAKLEAGDPNRPDQPILLSKVAPDAFLLAEESFGPVLCVSSFRTEAEAIAHANGSNFALSASVWTADLARGRRVAAALHAGTCAVNDAIRNIANPHAAFGGNRASGYGRYHGAAGLQAFSRVKTVMTTASRTNELHWFPLTPKKMDGLQKLLELRHRPHGLLRAIRRLFLMTLAAAMATQASVAQPSAEAHLHLHLLLPVNAHGRAAYAIFRSRDGFPNEAGKSLRHEFSAPADSSGVLDIDAGALPPGQYAVAVYLDENGNHKLDTRAFGIPREPVGASNNPRGRFGPPRFSECAFQMGDSDQTLSIRLVAPR